MESSSLNALENQRLDERTKLDPQFTCAGINENSHSVLTLEELNKGSIWLDNPYTYPLLLLA